MYVYCTYESARSKNVHVLNAIWRLSRDQDVLHLGLVLVSSHHTMNTPVYINLCCKHACVNSISLESELSSLSSN
jgi:hypothetical protein